MYAVYGSMYTYVYLHAQWDIIIPDRVHPYFSEGTGNLIFPALEVLVVRSKTSKFEAQYLITNAFRKFWVGSTWNHIYLPLNATNT